MKSIALAAALVLGGCTHPTPTVTISAGLNPRLSPAAVEGLAREAVANALDTWGRAQAPDAVSITAIRGGPTVGGYLAGTSWIVELHGTFTVTTGRHPTTTRPATVVLVHVSDDDGSIISVDFVEP
jgi:hypothetical protein